MEKSSQEPKVPAELAPEKQEELKAQIRKEVEDEVARLRAELEKTKQDADAARRREAEEKATRDEELRKLQEQCDKLEAKNRVIDEERAAEAATAILAMDLVKDTMLNLQKELEKSQKTFVKRYFQKSTKHVKAALSLFEECGPYSPRR